MIDSKYHVEINGVKYRLAEDAEGQHYQLNGEPLRPPNAVTVQGESQQTFQVRPDLLVWSLTDASGGEGQEKWRADAPNRWYRLNGVDVFSRPGVILPGPAVEDTLLASTGTDFTTECLLVSAAGGLYAFDIGSANYYTWNSTDEDWDGPQAITGPADGAESICTDGDKIFFFISGDGDLYSIDPGGTTATALATSGLPASAEHICEQGNNVYVGPDIAVGTKAIFEVDKAGSTPTEIDSFTIDVVNYALVPMEGKVYAMASTDNATEIREIIPTNAASTGFGRQLAKLTGFGADDMWQHSGILFLIGQYGDEGEGAILYLQPDGTYGTLGKIREGDSLGELTGPARSNTSNVRLLDHFFTTADRDSTDTETSLWIIDAVSGGFSNFAYGAVTGDGGVRSVVVHGNEIFWQTLNPTRIVRTISDSYATAASAISARHDFGLAEEKILSGVTIYTDPLPSDWTLNVDYVTDWLGSSFTTAITFAGDDTSVAAHASGVAGGTIGFRTLQIRLRMTWTGAGVPTSRPAVHGIEVQAQVLKKQRVWEIMVDLADDVAHNGFDRVTNLETAGNSNVIFTFKDGYQDRRPNKYEEYDAFIDDYDIVLDRPGEGFARLRILEIL